MSYDEILEKAYYWNEDQCFFVPGNVDKSIKTTFNPTTKKFKQETLPSLHKSKPQNKLKYENLKTPWRGIEEYFKQCATTELNNKL